MFPHRTCRRPEAGLSLDEIIAYEDERFEEAYRNHDGMTSVGEGRQPEGRLPGGVTGFLPGQPPQPRENP